MKLDIATSRAVSRCLSRLRHQNPFFATLALFAGFEASQQVPTAATDGKNIFINPEFFHSLSPEEQEGVLLHEVLHAALLHVTRRAGRNHILWNIAADIVVNGMVLKAGYILPDGAVIDKALEHLSTEEVFELLQRNQEQPPAPGWEDLLDQSPGDAAGAGVPGTEEGVIGQDRKAALEAHWRNAQEQGRVVEESFIPGAIPASLERELRNLDAAQLDWRSYLWRYLVRTPTDFMDFDRRFIGQGLYLETLAGESLRVAVAVDTSGSVMDDQVRMFVSEVQGLLLAYPHLRCDLYYADAALHGPYPLTPGGDIPPPVGGGGTDFRPFFTQVALDNDPWEGPHVCVYLTDGYGNFPDEAPSLPVLWVVTPGGLDVDSFPFGEAVRLLRQE